MREVMVDVLIQRPATLQCVSEILQESLSPLFSEKQNRRQNNLTVVCNEQMEFT